MSTDISQAPAVAIHLMDPSFQRPIKSWRFAEKAVITLGRSDDQDIEISDPYVSRNHAEFHFVEGAWQLHSKGRNGVLVNNLPIEQYTVQGDTTFRLGPNGPTLRFQITSSEQENNRTLCFDTLPAGFFGVDRRKVEDEVEQIADGDYFRSLKEKAEVLRRQRQH